MVLDHENGTEDPNRIGHNKDLMKSSDNGCLQINDYWHFGHNGWTRFNDIYNPTFNAALAYKIYQGRGWRSWYAAKGIYW